MTHEVYYDNLLTEQGKGWRKTLGMETGELPYNESTDQYTLPSGGTVGGNCGVYGIDPNGNVTYGWDGSIEESGPSSWTTQDREAFANMMIARWTKWRDKQSDEPR